MPNQLSPAKRRKSLSEQEAVLSALEVLARHDGTSVNDQMRRAIREWIKTHPDAEKLSNELRVETQPFAPTPPRSFAGRKQVRQFKRAQREFDQLMLDLGLISADAIEARNSMVAPGTKIQVIGFGETHDQ